MKKVMAYPGNRLSGPPTVITAAPKHAVSPSAEKAEKPEDMERSPGTVTDRDPELGNGPVGSKTYYPVRSVSLSSILLDDRVQSRAQLMLAVVEEYTYEMENGSEFPPLVVFEENGSYFLADGFHRHLAAEQAGRIAFDCEVRPGGLREAILWAAGANSTHGLQRSADDKRKAVLKLLNDGEWRQWSDRRIALHCHVGHQLVGKLRTAPTSVTGPATSEESKRKYQTKHGTVASMDTANIGRKRDKSVELVQPEFEGTGISNNAGISDKSEVITGAPMAVDTDESTHSTPDETDVGDANPDQADRHVGPDEALGMLKEFAKFVIERIGRHGKNIVISVAQEDVHEFHNLLGRAKMAVQGR